MLIDTDGRPAPSQPQTAPAVRRTSWSPLAIVLALLAFVSLAWLALISIAGIVAWRWADQNLLHLGLHPSAVKTINQTELLRQVRAFELVSVKQTYATHTQKSLAEAFGSGQNRVALPGWLAGEQIDVQGDVEVAAGVDLSHVGPNDLQVSQSGRDLRVQIQIPAAEVLSTGLVPGTLRVSSKAGLLTQLGQALGLDNDRLRDGAADALAQAGRTAAVQQGIEAQASHEAETRLQEFLQGLPQSGGRVSYSVVARKPQAERPASAERPAPGE